MKITKEQIMLNEVRVLTLNEPFASLMAFHGKQETRNRDTKVRGLVCIHAAKLPYGNDKMRELCTPILLKVIDSLVPYRLTNRSKIIAIGYLVGTKCVADYPYADNEIAKKCFVNYNSSLWIWEFEDMTPIQPFYFKGKQGWTILTPEQKQLINPLK